MASIRFDLKLLGLVLWVILECTLRSLSEIYVPLHWTHLNPLFKTSKSSSSPSILRQNVLPKSRLNIICPNAALNPVKMHQSPAKDHLYENLWVVDKQSFDTCRVNTSLKANRLLLQCDTPLIFKHYPLVFLEFSPAKQFMEFQKGKDYYFISTSDGTKNSLKSTKGGHCKTASMKFIIHVCLNDQDPLCQDKPPTTTAPPTTQPTTTTTTKPTTKSTRIPTTQEPTTTVSPTTTPLTEQTIRTLKQYEITPETMQNADVTKRDQQTNAGTEKTVNKSPDMETAKGERSAADIARDATWFILMAVMGALLVVSISCNLYTICIRNKAQRRSETVDDKRSSAVHTLLRDNSRVDKV
ncbi:ephrin-B1 [Exaiptasia diaphana]|uniref:Ephrin RBD domain-containing protein n=1 Tax=Exaiptasia diaphana TaxID=2652724 RepID=A0A913XJW2_EXADI|nr:ephrin-B1 [Exaiptasia diaphana]